MNIEMMHSIGVVNTNVAGGSVETYVTIVLDDGSIWQHGWHDGDGATGLRIEGWRRLPTLPQSER